MMAAPVLPGYTAGCPVLKTLQSLQYACSRSQPEVCVHNVRVPKACYEAHVMGHHQKVNNSTNTQQERLLHMPVRVWQLP